MAIYLNGQIVSGGGQTEIQDSVTIVNNGEAGLDAVGVVSKSGRILYDWIGTKEEYESGIADGSIDNEWVCWITDDDGSELSSGVYVGSIVKMINTENYVPEGLLYCDGSEYRRDQFEGFYDNYLSSLSEQTAPMFTINDNIVIEDEEDSDSPYITNFNSPITLNLNQSELFILQVCFRTGEDITTKQIVYESPSDGSILYIENGYFYTENGVLRNKEEEEDFYVLANQEYSIVSYLQGMPPDEDNPEGIPPLTGLQTIDFNVHPEKDMWGDLTLFSYDKSYNYGYSYNNPSDSFLGKISVSDGKLYWIDTSLENSYAFYGESGIDDSSAIKTRLACCSYEEYQNELSEKGYCDKIAVDYNNQLFRVPTINNDGDKKHYIVAAEGSMSQSIMDWSAWQGSLEGKANKTDIPDLTNYVKNTDYATSSKHGIIKVDLATGINVDGTGKAYISKATDSLVTAKTNNYRPLTPSNIDLAVKTGITTNTIELTNEEKTNAKNWLGISDEYAKITNCLLEVPQNIKLELNDNELTLKAGSVVIVPYGTENLTTTYPIGSTFIDNNFKVVDSAFSDSKFTLWVELQTDLVGGIDSRQQTRMATVDFTRNKIMIDMTTTDPTAEGNFIYYDTTTYKLTQSGTTGDTTRVLSLPFGTVSKDATIDQVFNGMGYIGSTVWVDKGVKGLVANGRNANGTYNNLEKTRNDIAITTLSGFNDISMFMNFDSNSLDYVERQTVEYTSNPTATCKRYYDEDENYWYNHESNTIVPFINIINLTLTYGKISNFEVMDPFKAVDYNKVKDLLDVRKQRVNRTSGSGTISIGGDSSCNMYYHEVVGATTISLVSQSSFSTFELCLKMHYAYSITLPSEVKWLDNEAPDMSEVGVYYLVFRYDNVAGNWYANLQGRWSL